MLTTVKGSVFSLDLLFSFMIISVIFVLAVNSEAGLLFGNSESLKVFELEEKALLVADSLVKNLDGNNALLGSAFFDSGKHRVVSNFVDFDFLKTASPQSFGRVSVFELSVQGKNSLKTAVFSTQIPAGSNCFAVQRFVLLQQGREKALVRVVACES